MVYSFFGHTRSTDTCDYISQYNELGGLDCALLSVAPYEADSYQWLNCDSLYAPFVGDTTYFFTSEYSGDVALEVTVGNCVDTSYCQYHCIYDLKEEYKLYKKEIVKIVDLTGKETEEKPNTLLIYIFSDGTTEKVFRVD